MYTRLKECIVEEREFLKVKVRRIVKTMILYYMHTTHWNNNIALFFQKFIFCLYTPFAYATEKGKVCQSEPSNTLKERKYFLNET